LLDAPAQTFDSGPLERRIWLLAAALGVVVAATAYGCVFFPREHGRISPIWVTNAWIVAALVRLPQRHWPLLLASAFLGNSFANHLVGDTNRVAASLAFGNGMESLACAWLVRRRCGPIFDIGRVGHLATFIFATIAGALGGAAVVAVLLGIGDPGDLVRGVMVWLQADVLGLLTLAPSLLVLTQKSRTPFVWRESWTLVVLAVVAWVVFFHTHYPFLFLISAILALPTWRMGLPGAVAGFAIIAALGTLAALSSNGPITLTVADGVDRIIGLQIFLTVSFLTSVPVAVARDTSERMKARLTQALAEARAASALAETAAAVKTEFLANMSHELRTPLTSVVGFTRLAIEQPDLTPISRGYIERVGEASRALLCTVNDILDFSKLEAGQVTFRPEPVALASLLRTTLDLFTPQAAAKDLALVLEDTTPAGLVVTLDPDRLRQVLLNLVGNAVKFTDTGQVTLLAAYDEVAERLSIEVIDTGPGIPANRLDRLFKRFSQVDGSLTRDHGGTGLGLAICKGIVEAMGGEIGVQTVLGQGSRFWLTAPVPRTQAAVPAAVVEAAALSQAGVRILVTDDHPANRELVKLFLAAISAEITEAGDGETAAEIAAVEPFDVILMDLRMPRLDGVGAVARIRSRPGPNQSTPILAFTADAESAFDERLKALGFQGAVAKPLEPGALIASLANALAVKAPDLAREVA
jgi:signal transduction histidine kinase/CheY-like chemotaxis protein